MAIYWILGAALALLLLLSLRVARTVWRVVWKTGQSLPRLEGEVGECRRTVQQELATVTAAHESLSHSVDSVSQEFARLQESASQMNEQLKTHVDMQVRVAQSDVQWKAHLDSAIASLSQQLADIRANLPAKPGYEDPVPFVEAMAEPDVLRIAERLAFARPLVPYPNWYFAADWENPDLAYRIRRSIWTYFSSRRTTAPLDIPWYGDLKLRIHLGNDVSRLLFVAGCIDPNEFALLDKLLMPGMVVVDAGANEGIYTVFASQRVGNTGSVWAFEPSKREFERLEANVRLNQFTNVHSFCLALADENAAADLSIAEDEHAGHNTLGQFVYAETQLSGRESVPLRRLDSFLQENALERLDFLKLDVEGAEMRVLAGAREALSRFRPLILLEANEPSLKAQGSSREEMIRFLESQAYRLYLFDPGTGLPVSASEGSYGDNMLAAPVERNLPETALVPFPARRYLVGSPDDLKSFDIEHQHNCLEDTITE